MTHSGHSPVEPIGEVKAVADGSAQMLTTLTALRDTLRHARLPLEIPGVEESRHASAEIIDQLEDYVLPRLVQIDAPLLAVVGGSTGAGKSTLVNSLVGEQVSEPGAQHLAYGVLDEFRRADEEGLRAALSGVEGSSGG